jgi:hypothetical protein
LQPHELSDLHMLFTITDLVQILLITLGHHIVAVNEPERCRVNTVAQAAGISRAIVENMAKMTIAV